MNNGINKEVYNKMTSGTTRQTILLLKWLLTGSIISAQSMQSPYSFFGIGQIHRSSTGISSGLGGSGIALPSTLSLNPINPASYGGIDSLHFIFELGFTIKQSAFTSTIAKGNHFDGMVNYVALGFKPHKRFGLSIGLRPFSTISYYMTETEKAEGEIVSVKKYFQGDGAINQFYAGSSFNLLRNLSAGINLSYFFGSIKRSEISKSDLFTDEYSFQQNNYVKSFYVDYGLQYKIPLRKYSISIGIIEGNQQRLNSSTSAYFSVGSDTIHLQSPSVKISLPLRYGIGISLIKNENYSITADYEVFNFKGITSNNPLLEITDGKRFSLGAEISPGDISLAPSGKKTFYRFGGFYQQSYMKIDGIPVPWSGITFGAGIPVKNNLSYMNFTLEAGILGTRKKNLIKENYFLLHLDLSLHDLWFQKRKFN